MLRAIIKAQQWLDADGGANRKEAVEILSRPNYVGADAEVRAVYLYVARMLVVAVDTGAPTITLIGSNPILHELQTPFTDPGATANDAADGDLDGQCPTPR